MHCPGLNPGCKCRECYGLREAMVALTGRDHGLPAARATTPPTLRVIETRCDSMTCTCERCTSERASPPPRPRARQPWEPRPARRRAA